MVDAGMVGDGRVDDDRVVSLVFRISPKSLGNQHLVLVTFDQIGYFFCS